MLAVTAEQMRRIDAISMTDYGVPGIVLMENAAIRIAEETLKVLSKSQPKHSRSFKAAMFAGQGNNGGDVFAAARHLHNKGIFVKVFIVADSSRISGDSLINLNIIKGMELDIAECGVCGPTAVKGALDEADVILDGIFGTGFKGSIQGMAAGIVDMINESASESGKPVIAIDIPSGVNADTGRAEGPFIKATRTVTLGLPKIGLMILPGCEYAGELVVADISIPAGAIDRLAIKSHVIDFNMVKPLFKARPKGSNKGGFGKAVLFTGSKGMTGAGCLAAEAILRVGAGLAYTVVPSSLAGIYNSSMKEIITIPIDDAGSPGYFPDDAYTRVPELLKSKTVAAIGPGMTVRESVRKLTEELLKEARIPLVIDADALNVLNLFNAPDAPEDRTSVLTELVTEAVLTPHPGEMARLTGMSIGQVQEDRIGTAVDFAAAHKVILVLKGARTVVAVPDGTFFINTTGNPGMATAGSGDVLTGIITGLAAQGFRLQDAAVAGVFLHGLAGDLASMEKGEYGMIAGDILGYLPEAILGIMGI